MTAAALLAILVIALALITGMIGAALAGQVAPALVYLGLVMLCLVTAFILLAGRVKG